jgi:hypothetical protein
MSMELADRTFITVRAPITLSFEAHRKRYQGMV